MKMKALLPTNSPSMMYVGLVLAAVALSACGDLGFEDSDSGFFDISEAACDIKGQDDVLTFCDTTRGLEQSFSVADPIAAGSRVDLEISFENKLSAVQEVTSADGAIVSVESFDHSIVKLRAHAAGRTTVVVKTADGQEDRVELAVQEIASSRIVLLPWIAPFALPADLWADGITLVTDTPVTLFAQHRGENDELLSGYGAQPITLEQGEDARLNAKDGTNEFTLVSGRSLEELVVKTADKDSLSIEVVDLDSVERLELYQYSADPAVEFIGDKLELSTENSQALLHIAAYTSDNRYIIGAGDSTPEITLGEGSEGVVQFTFSQNIADSNEEDESDNDFLLRSGRAIVLDVLQEGSTSLHINWTGHERTYPVEISPAP